MCCKKGASLSGRCLKWFSVILFLVSVGLFVASVTMFNPVNQNMASGKINENFAEEGNVLGAKMCKWGGTFGIVMSIFAYLTAT